VGERSPGTVVAWVVAAVLATLAVLRLVGGEDGGASPSVRVDGAAAGGAAQSGEASGGGGRSGSGDRGAREGVYVHVAGAVRRPGLFRLPAGSRVAAAVARAGGPRPRADLALVNLAARVQDGQQVVVPGPGVAPPAGSGPAGAPAAGGAGLPGAKPSLATATVEQLEELDGIGPTLAERIIEYRDTHGGLRSLAELQEVEGIGEKRFESLREALVP
jgi:competence protein ComEA